MQEHAMSISIKGKSLALSIMLAAVIPAGAAHAQMKTEDPDVMDVARTPLEDFNIKSEDIPEVLLAAVRNPYEDTGINSCNDVVSRIAVLDNVLGADFDIPQEERANISAGRVAKTVVGSFVPFRGIVREVTGANKKRNERRLAYTAGMVRRGYLKGMGEARGCSYPAKPREVGNALVPGVSSPVPPNIPRGKPEGASQESAPGNK
jgi:hypothetical protein